MPNFPDDYFTAIFKGVPHNASGIADSADLSDMSELFLQWVHENTAQNLGACEVLEAILQAIPDGCASTDTCAISGNG